MDNRYNGWRNRETWLVNLWFGDGFSADAAEGIEVSEDYIRETIENRVEECVNEPNGFVMDMLDLGAIDWHELAEAYFPEKVITEEDA